MNKILVKLYVPTIEQQYEIWLPINKKKHKIIKLLVKSVYEFSGGHYNPTKMPMLYDRATGNMFDVNLNAKENNIKNGAGIILI